MAFRRERRAGFGWKTDNAAVSTARMTSPPFRKISASDSFRVEVGFGLTSSNSPGTIERIERWIVESWTPKNRVWARKWRTGPWSDGIVQIQELPFSDTFVHSPETRFLPPTTLVIAFDVRERKWWRDWLVKLIHDLKGEFPELSNILFCKYQD